MGSRIIDLMLCISPYLVQMRENTDQKKLRVWTLFTQCKRFMHSHLKNAKVSGFQGTSSNFKKAGKIIDWLKIKTG